MDVGKHMVRPTDGPPDWEIEGVSLRSVSGGELLGATSYGLPPGTKWADLHYHHA